MTSTNITKKITANLCVLTLTISILDFVKGAPVWSVDNDAMPITFFDERTGEFVDSVQARIRSRLFVNFGNRK